MYTYAPAERDVNDLELVQGDIITKIDTMGEPPGQGWWFGHNSKGESGTFPSNYVEMIQPPPHQCK